MRLRQQRFACSACGPFIKNKRRIQKLKVAGGDSHYIYQNKLDKTCFQYDMTYGDFKDLHQRTASHETKKTKIQSIFYIFNFLFAFLIY